MHQDVIERVHNVANLLAYELGIPDFVRHPVRFFNVRDILRAVGEEQSENSEHTLPSIQAHVTATHAFACHCRFCATDLLDTRILKRPLP